MTSDFTTLNGMPSLVDEVNAVADVFQLAMYKPCTLYSPAQSSQSAIDLHQEIAKSHVSVPQENLFYPMGNFIVNEQYIHVDQTQWVKANANHIFGIYGSEDGLFTTDVLADVQTDLSANPSPYRFQLIPGAAHSVYIDQQDKFIQAVINDLK